MTDERSRLDVLVAGPAYCDLVFAELDRIPEPGTERFARRFLTTAGGSAITAVALARLGRSVALIADLGDDVFGVLIRDLLEAEGVDVRWLRVLPGASTPVTAVLSTPGERSFVTHLPADALPLDLAGALAESGARHLHIAGFPLAQSIPDAVEIARRSGATASFDPGWDETALADPAVRRVARQADALLPSRDEAVRLVDGEPDMELEVALELLSAARGHGVVAVTNGSAGAVARTGTDTYRATAPEVEAVDPTGAGDVFDAGFLDAWLRGAGLEAALRRGAACGAHAVTILGGAISAPWAAQLDARTKREETA